MSIFRFIWLWLVRLVRRPVLGSLLASLCILLSGLVWAQEEDAEFSPPPGAPFFLLTDSSYASDEEAKVRFEAKSEDLMTIAQADGAEIALYRVEQPLEFLKKQRNLHRIELKAAARPEGLANTLSYVWDQWVKRARQIWQNLFAGKLRVATTQAVPQLKTAPTLQQPTDYVYQGAYKALPGLQEVSRMRYPVQAAKPIAQPKDLKLEGSSSEFMPTRQGNVYIPLGRQKPGLYVVEAAVGRQRAVALLFVSDTITVSKTAANQFLVWTAQRAGGLPAAQTQVVWSDLNGVLGSGTTDNHGVLVVNHSVPETSYAFGQDSQGGVFITENFYYDSEIYNTKLYAYTDRPLYRPGDEVHIRLYGREFQSATHSIALATAPIQITVQDSGGTPVYQTTVNYQSDLGAATRFTLPDNATAGGYEIVMKRGEAEYSAAFRVAPYVKPHFEVHIEPAQASFKTGEAPTGLIRLHYPDGQPVKNAQIDLSARAQVLTMVDGDLAYGGLFPLQIDNNQALTTDSDGVAKFKLPAAKEPSRLILTVLASDGAAQKVRATQDLLIERGAASWRLQANRQFAAPKERVEWTLSANESSSAGQAAPTRWVAIHQESRSRSEGSLAAQARQFTTQLERPGSYMLELHDAQDRLVGAAPFWVSGGELKPPQGSIDIVLDKNRYRAGDVAKALITFPVPVKDALLTLERDQVEAYGRLLDPRGLARLHQLNDRQWQAEITVQAEHAPNITLSVAYVFGSAQGSEFGFQNAGIVVEQPTLQVALKTDRSSYLPGDTVTVDIVTRNPAGQGVSAVLSLAAVDEMVYALQPELAPSLQEFFYHVRRNNVRTHSSLAFITFDEAIDPTKVEGIRRNHQERGVKVLERPRRDERDTAYFAPAIVTNAQGQAQVRFVVPDSLTRWRLTAKAYGQGAADGLVGEKRAAFISDKPFFARWTSATWLRAGDETQASVTVFNQTAEDADIQLVMSRAGQTLGTQKIKAHRGANQVALALPPAQASWDIQVAVQQASRVIDQLQTHLQIEPVAWMNERLSYVPVSAGVPVTAIKLPGDARHIRARLLGSGASAWAQVADSLIDYPYGCLEQTASRLISLALAAPNLVAKEELQQRLHNQLYTARLRLVAMAGPDAIFSWWGRGTANSAFLSAYAYYADHLAARSLNLPLPAGHAERLLEIYSKEASRDSLSQRAWSLWLMHSMGLPTGTMVEGLMDHWRTQLTQPTTGLSETGWGPLSLSKESQSAALVLTAALAQLDHKPWPAALQPALAQAQQQLANSPDLLAQAVLAATGGRTFSAEALLAALQATSAEPSTLDRALALSLLAQTSGPQLNSAQLNMVSAGAVKKGWASRLSAAGQTEWLRPDQAHDAKVPLTMLLEWETSPPQAAALAVRYQSSQAPSQKLPLSLERKLYRLDKTDKGFKAIAVQAGEALRTDALYMDEVTVQSNQAMHYAIAELALPPGAMLETSTWGIKLVGEKEPQPIDSAVGEERSNGYTIPFDSLAAHEKKQVRHLLRFTQKGQFRIPAARLWRMYQPDAQAVEAGPAVQTWRLP